MKTITLLPERDYMLHNNDIYVLGATKSAKLGQYIAACFSDEWRITKCVNDSESGLSDWHLITASTANLEGVKQLDRKDFVKKEDVEELAIKQQPYTEDKFDSNDWNNIDWWKAGYNANKGEFERGHMFDLFCRMQMGKIKTIEEWEQYMNEIQPLSLPTSIIVDESYNIIKLNW